MNNRAWMRVLRIKFTSTKLKNVIEFGTANKNQELTISVTGTKYLSPLKDAFTIQIKNLTYSEIIRLIDGEYYDVEIIAGYKNGNQATIFKGGVLYISNRLNSDRTQTAIILCASELVAKYNQKKLNLTLNSGINLYSALKFVCERAGIPNSNVSTEFKKEFITNVLTINDNCGSWLEQMLNSTSGYINSDSCLNSTLNIFDANNPDVRVISLDSSNIILTGGYPRLTSEGLKFTMLPTFNFMCGDIVKIDNSIIDISATSQSQSNKMYGNYLDKNQSYFITEQRYSLSNRDSEFSLELTCKSRNLLSNITSK